MKNLKRLLLLFMSLFTVVLSISALSSCGECLHPIKSAYTTVKEATCTETGLREAKCSDCGEIISETISKKAHDYDDYSSDSNATCAFIGTLSAKCKNCDTKKTKLADGNPYGHTYFDGVCSECSDTMTLLEGFDVSKGNDKSVMANVYLGKDGHYELDIVGNGEMRDFTEGTAPYAKYSSDIDTLHIYEGVSRIGSYAFYELSLIDNIYIEKGHKSFGTNAFKSTFSASVTHVYDLDSWAQYDFDDEGIPPLYMTTLIYVGEVVREGDTVEVKNKSTRIGNLTLSEGVTKINPYAFYNDAHILTVQLPTTLTSIGEYAFYGCGGIEEVYAPSIEMWCRIDFGKKYSNPLIYGKNLFIDDGVTSNLIKDLVIPESVSEIKYGVFEGCDGLTSLTIMGNVTVIPSFAFASCSNLKSITLSPSVTTIDSFAFYSCSSLKELTLPDSLTTLNADAFRDCTSLTSLDTGNGITTIPDSAFAGCIQLVRLTLGENITEIRDNAFFGCNKIYEIMNLSALNVSELDIAENALFIYSDDSDSRICEITDGENGEGLIFYIDSQNGLKLLIGYLGKKTDLKLDSTIMGGGYAIYKNAFLGRTIKTLTISSGITRIYPSAFLDMTLGSLIIEDLNEWCKIDFDDKSASPVYVAEKVSIEKESDELTAIEIPEGITTIKPYTFAGFGGVKTITIPKSVTKIERDAFLDCISAIKTTSGASYIEKWLVGFEGGKTSATILENTVGIVEGVFENTEVTAFTVSASQLEILPKDKVVSLTIRDGELPESAFVDFTSLKSITINSSVKSVDEKAFLGAVATEYSIASSYINYLNKAQVTSLTLTSGSIKRADIIDLTSLTTLVISSGVTNIEDGCFKDMTSITSLSIRGGITVIPKEAFSGCTSITSIALYTGLNSIREDAFKNCTGIITTENGVDYIQGWVVEADKSAESVIISKDTVGIADGVFDKNSSIKTIYYMGLYTDWTKVKQNLTSNVQIKSASVYFYREIAPFSEGNFWHFVDGVPTPWPPFTNG